MRLIIIILLLLLVWCGVASAISVEEDQHYIVVVVVWDNVTGSLEMGVPVTFGGLHTLYTSDDGSVVYDTANLGDVMQVSVSCKYGIKNVRVVRDAYGTGVTFNEPDEITAIEAFAALGFAAIALGGGRYMLRRKKNGGHGDAIMADETSERVDTRSKFVRDFGVRAAIAIVAMASFGIACIVAVYSGDMGMIDAVARVFTPVISVIIIFYYGGSMVRDWQVK